MTARTSEWLPLVVRLRTEEGATWDDVVRAVNAQAAGHGKRGEDPRVMWTKARLAQAVRALVREGLAPASVIRAVAAVVGENPRASLQEVADRLAALRLYPPRGGTRWSISSVARVVHIAKREGLLPARA